MSKIPECMHAFDVVWNSPSWNSAGSNPRPGHPYITNYGRFGSAGSMPCGGHDVGMNIWVEGSDLLFYFDRSGNLDENDQQLKCGRVRMRFEPDPFAGRQPFRQELKLRDGYVEIRAGNPEVQIALWVDVFSATIHADIRSQVPVAIRASYESWRSEPRELALDRRQACLSFVGHKGRVVTYPDTVGFEDNGVLFFHRNRNDDLVRDKLIALQKLEPVAAQIPDTQRDRTFGGLMCGEGMKPSGMSTGVYLEIPFTAHTIATESPVTEQRITWVLHTAQSPTLEAWREGLKSKLAADTGDHSATKAWWHAFWGRSHISINPGAGPTDPAWQVGRNYQLFRYLLGCNARGEYPSRFNGSLFTLDPRFCTGRRHDVYYVDADYNTQTPDFRNWGGGSYTSQNQRLVYWPLLKSGDFDLMVPQFDFFRRGLPSALARVGLHWGHGGCCFSEHVESFGLPIGWAYGWPEDEDPTHMRTPDLDAATEAGQWIRYYYDSQLEFSLMILRYARFSGNDITPWLPFITESVRFFDEHYRMRGLQLTGQEFDANGRYRFAPTKALENYKDAVNPLPTIAALKALLPELLHFAAAHPSSTLPAETARWAEMLTRLPELPVCDHDGRTIFSPAESFDPCPMNMEDPQLYAVFPYPIAQPGTPEFQIARDTWHHDPLQIRMEVCWGQSEIWAAKLGLTEEARHLIVSKLRDSRLRFPAFWGPGPDWVPDVDHGGAGMIGLQEMLLQTDGDKLLLLPAWPLDWDVDFKLHAPEGTLVECTFRDGKIERLEVTPASRRSDVVLPGGEGRPGAAIQGQT